MSADTPSKSSAFSPKNTDWANTAIWMLEIRKNESWFASGASSFTDCLNKYAKSTRKTPFVFWRGLAAAEFYLDYRAQHPDMKLPPLESLAHVSPENLELLAKISRHAPDELVRKLMPDLLNKKIGRTRLKDTWEIFRGPTERLEVVHIPDPVPRVIKSPTVQRLETAKSRAEATLLGRLLEQGWAWCCDSEPGCYKFFPYVKIPFSHLGTASAGAIDAVGVVAMPGGKVELHGVFVARNHDDEIADRLVALAVHQPYLDFSWLAILGPIDAQLVAKIPLHVGVIEIRPLPSKNDKRDVIGGRGNSDDVDPRPKVAKNNIRSPPVHRIRAPAPTAADGVNSGIVAKLLLTRN
jgi:hypothetical protein